MTKKSRNLHVLGLKNHVIPVFGASKFTLSGQYIAGEDNAG